MAKQAHPHSDDLIHQVDADDNVPSNPDPLSDGDGIQCGHVCHGHAPSIASEPASIVVTESNHYAAFNAAVLPSLSHAPPTPPPNV